MGSRYDSSGYGDSHSPDDYGYGRYSGSGMRSSDAAGGYRKVDNDPSPYSRDSYVRESPRRQRRERADDEGQLDRGNLEDAPWRAFARRDSQADRLEEDQFAEETEEQLPAEDRRPADRARLRAEAAARIAERESTPRSFRREAAPMAQDAAYEGRSEEPQEPDMKSRYSRSTSSYVAKSPSGGKNTKRTVGIVIGVILAVLLVGAGVAFAYFNGIIGKMNKGVDDSARAALVQTDMAKEPFYVLLLGTDKSQQREDDNDLDGSYRTDSMMLARIDPVGKKVTMVSIPRDTLVDLGEFGYQRINAAYTCGGPALAIKAVSQLAGVNISHYAEIDFDGFAAMVDALGGVEVDVPVDIDDWTAGGSVSAGLHTLSGEEALILCRSRATYADSAAPDLMRAANQRLVLSAIAHKLLASDIATIAATVSAMSEYVTTDLALNDIIGLAQVMQGLDSADDIYTASFPTESVYIYNGATYVSQGATVPTGSVDPNIDEGYYLLPDEGEWQKMKARMEKGEPPAAGTIVDEATGTVLATAGADADDVTEKYSSVIVKNATDTQGLAARTSNALEKAGFQNVMIGEVVGNEKYPETIVVYNDASKEYEAGLIVKAMGQGKAILNDGSYLMDTDFLVVIGDDWKSGESS